MLVYGSNAKTVHKEVIADPCPNCNNPNCVEMNVFSKYVHLFWIPFFPIGKTGVSQCMHCKQVLKLNEMPSTLVSAYKNMLPNARTPIWSFAGLGLAACIIAIAVYSQKQIDKKNAKLILSPQKGDIYTVKNDNDNYMLFKVNEVRGDTVVVFLSQFESNTESGTDKILDKGAGGFFDEENAFLKSELKEMFDKETIVDIDRN